MFLLSALYILFTCLKYAANETLTWKQEFQLAKSLKVKPSQKTFNITLMLVPRDRQKLYRPRPTVVPIGLLIVLFVF